MPKQPHNHREENYYKQSKQKGYRARSAFKLLDIHKRFNIFKRAFYILDIGCAPGSWLQVSREFAEKNLTKYNDQFYHRDHFKIMGVDIQKTSPLEDITTIKMDIYNPEFQNKLEEFFQGQKLDVILSDASINKSGNKFSDQVRQIRLCYKILEITKINLKKKGLLLIKIFQGQDMDEFIIHMKKGFQQVKSYKPTASKKKSNEIYLIGFKKK